MECTLWLAVCPGLEPSGLRYKRPRCRRPVRSRAPRKPYLEDLEAGDVQDADEGGPLPLGLVQGLVDPHHQPAEHPLVGRLSQRLHRKLRLLLGLSLLHVVPSHLRRGESDRRVVSE